VCQCVSVLCRLFILSRMHRQNYWLPQRTSAHYLILGYSVPLLTIQLSNSNITYRIHGVLKKSLKCFDSVLQKVQGTWNLKVPFKQMRSLKILNLNHFVYKKSGMSWCQSVSCVSLKYVQWLLSGCCFKNLRHLLHRVFWYFCASNFNPLQTIMVVESLATYLFCFSCCV